ncbi:hypothetical protein OS493_008529 [Desmophyllum pertusum]|uniref:Uncharacterized protein n=1 Tax=Desmophyllum pertusum TaxID=174260 RepID=A0A9W9ZRY8_9CNID|nr:hypothetical protein OS493_008529 [Desmophyllum pertusum]
MAAETPMVKGKIVIAVLALILFFLLVGFVRNLFQIPDDKVVGIRHMKSGVMAERMRTNQQHIPVDTLKFFYMKRWFGGELGSCSEQS